ncbi:hypothetical protein ASD8599_00014 [Ascidiaceihabitans donghaensis]|uniref:Solute-binding protein family 3/N-terminal domain-containing protein n=2 Tax=Ascidiaceihabitans donghaensis TaxID=1510460 RepID=A0A2R8B8C9_9RHOB|nr:hypothetical protein ASD8599_00014 [Ascidiaceihabitans donghaensis]
MTPPLHLLLAHGLVRMAATVFVALGVMVFSIKAAQAETVRVWVYHNFPPFVIDVDTQSGLSYDFARELTVRSDGQHDFVVEVLPRARLNRQMADGAEGIVFWANPVWFGDKEETKYLWSSKITSDSSVVMSRVDDPIEYTGPQSLLGMELVGIEGHRYIGVDELVQEGLMTRKDLHAESSAVQFISTGRGRVAILARSAADYFTRKLALTDMIHFASTPHSSYTRHVLVPKADFALRGYIDQVLDELNKSPIWRAV